MIGINIPKILMIELEAKYFKDILNHEISEYLSKQNFEPFYRTRINGDIISLFIDLEITELSLVNELIL